MKGRTAQALPGHLAAEQHVDDTLDRQVAEYSKLYSIDQWLQPRSMVQVQLAKLKEETRCPMCFGKIRSARISMVCLHRYCAKCIEQYLRAQVPGRHGDDKECPVCRAHLHSRRATKPDPAFDKIIKALYGDVDKFDAEEEALIEADNKAHMKAWQAQLADMKARQAAAVAAAKAAGPLPPEQRRQQQQQQGSLPRPPSGLQLAPAGASEGSGRKRSWAAAGMDGSGAENGVEEDDFYLANGFRAAAAGGSSKGGSKAARMMLTGGSKRSAFASAAGAAGTVDGATEEGLLPGNVSDGLNSIGSGGTRAALQKKKKSTMSAARMIAQAAQAAAAAGPPARCCVLQLIPQPDQQQQQQDAATSSAAAEAAAAGGSRTEGRSRKQRQSAAVAGGSGGSNGAGSSVERQPLQQLLPGQVAAPSIDQPFLSCPMGLTVRQLKQQLLMQLEQQGTTAAVKGQFELQLLLRQQQGLLAAAGGSNGSNGSNGVLRDELTVEQLLDRVGGLGAGVQVTYRLVGL